MDNNFNNNPQQFGGQPQQQFGGQPQQQFYGQPQFNGQPQQQFNGQPQPQFNGQPQQQFYGQRPMKAPSNMNVKALLALILSAVGALMSILGTAFTCSCSASKTFDVDKTSSTIYQTSAVVVLAFIGAVIAIVGVVLAILALKDDRKNVMALIALALGVFGFVIGFLPAITVCGYNCALESALKNARK